MQGNEWVSAHVFDLAQQKQKFNPGQRFLKRAAGGWSIQMRPARQKCMWELSVQALVVTQNQMKVGAPGVEDHFL